MALNDTDWLNMSGSGGTFSSGLDSDAAPSPNVPGKGGWHVTLTLVSLIAAIGVSFLLALITQNIPQRSVWLMGLIFMCPVAAVLLGALIVEDQTAVMTPRFNRGAQAAVALIATLVAFMIGCLGNLLYVQGFVKPKNIVFVMDRSSSMESSDPANESAQAIASILSTMRDDSRAGLVLFSDTVLDSVPIAALTQDQRVKLLGGLATITNGTTNFYKPISAALDMVENAALPKGLETGIVIVTDGEEQEADPTQQLPIHEAEVIARCKAAGVSISCVKLAGVIDPSLSNVVQQTGGKGVQVNNVEQLAGGITSVSASNHDLLRDRAPASAATAGVLLVMEGLVLGFALTLMLSHQRQKRWQLLLSPLMGLAAFILCKPLAYPLTPAWINEAVMFSLFGLVLMRKNRVPYHAPTANPAKNTTTIDF